MDERSFHHWDAHVLDAAAEVDQARELVHRLHGQGALSYPRAMYKRGGAASRLRQILLIDLGSPVAIDAPLGALRGLWLVEQENRKIFLYGTDHQPMRWRISGRILRDVPVLEPSSAWFDRIAESLAARTFAALGRDRCNGEGDIRLLTRIERALLDVACGAFFAGLDPEVLAVVRADGSPTWETYDHYWDGDGRFRRNRVQGAQCFPLLGHAFREDWRLRRAVDRGAPLERELAKRFQVQPRTIRSTRSPIAGRVPPNQRIAVMKRLDRLPAEYHPKSDEDWGVFLELSPGLCDLADLLGLPLAGIAQPFAKGWEHGRAALSAKWGAEPNIGKVLEMMQATYRLGVRPLLREAVRAVGYAAEVAEFPPPLFFPLWFGGCGLSKLVAMGHRWHLAYGQFSLDRLGLQGRVRSADLQWSALLRSATPCGSYRIVELADRQALELEGRELQHCVASYSVKCLLGISSIFSIRDQSGRALTTFEVGLANNNPVLLRHVGYGNDDPPDELRMIAKRFVHERLVSLPPQVIASVRAAIRPIGINCAFLM